MSLQKNILIFCICSVIVFISLYGMAAVLFPGGSWYNVQDHSFSFIHNYWCDLLAKVNKRGEVNPGSIYALSAMFVLCPAMMLFFWVFPLTTGANAKRKRLIQICGFISMLICLFIFTSLHDLVIPSAGLFGLIAMGYMFAEIKRMQMKKTFAFGMFCLVLIAANNFIWYTRIGVIGLPLIQKLTFIAFLALIVNICVQLIKHTVKHKTTADIHSTNA